LRVSLNPAVQELEFALDAADLAECVELEWQGHISPIQSRVVKAGET
jgi:hypothetical protein